MLAMLGKKTGCVLYDLICAEDTRSLARSPEEKALRDHAPQSTWCALETNIFATRAHTHIHIIILKDKASVTRKVVRETQTLSQQDTHYWITLCDLQACKANINKQKRAATNK